MSKEDEEIAEIESQIAQAEAALKSLDSGEQSSGYGSPTPKEKDSVFKFFREILTNKDSTRVSNLKDNEIGNSKIPTRAFLDIAKYAELEGLDKVADYLRTRSMILTDTAMSRKGFLAQLFVTQIKKEQKLGEPKPTKKTWWGGSKEITTEEEAQ